MRRKLPVVLTSEDAKRAFDRFQVQKIRLKKGRVSRNISLLFTLVGPGILVMLGENDGPSMLSYAATGSTFGIGFFLPFIVLTFLMAFVIQQMSSKLGAVSQRGHAELIFDRFGPFWGRFAMIDLVIGNLFTLVSEFIAIRAGTSFFGVPPLLSIIATCGIIVAVSLTRRYWTWERLTMGLALLNALFIPVALSTHPSASVIGHAFLTWSPLPGGITRNTMLLIMADIGATVTPWMVFFQQSAVMDKGLTPKDIGYSRIDTALGTICAALPAIATVIATTPLFLHHIDASNYQAAQFAQALVPYVGHRVASLFALGIIEAGVVAAITISTSSAYTYGEVTGTAHSFNSSLKEALPFYGVLLLSAICAGGLVLLPHVPLEAIILVVNVLATLSMPPAIVFLLLLANDKEIMGKYANSRITNIATILIVVFLCVVGLIWAALTLFPKVAI